MKSTWNVIKLWICYWLTDEQAFRCIKQTVKLSRTIRGMRKRQSLFLLPSCGSIRASHFPASRIDTSRTTEKRERKRVFCSLLGPSGLSFSSAKSGRSEERQTSGTSVSSIPPAGFCCVILSVFYNRFLILAIGPLD